MNEDSEGQLYGLTLIYDTSGSAVSVFTLNPHHNPMITILSGLQMKKVSVEKLSHFPKSHD